MTSRARLPNRRYKECWLLLAFKKKKNDILQGFKLEFYCPLPLECEESEMKLNSIPAVVADVLCMLCSCCLALMVLTEGQFKVRIQVSWLYAEKQLLKQN